MGKKEGSVWLVPGYIVHVHNGQGSGGKMGLSGRGGEGGRGRKEQGGGFK